MSQGLRPHWHMYVNDHIDSYYDHKKQCMIKKVYYYCPICALYGIDQTCYERYEYEPPPVKEKDKSKVLKKNKRRGS